MYKQDKLVSEANLTCNITQTDKWLIWKTKANLWTHRLKNAGHKFHQLFSTKRPKLSVVDSNSGDGGGKVTSGPHSTRNTSNSGLN